MKKSDNNAAVILNVVFFLGILAHSAIIFFVHKTMRPLTAGNFERSMAFRTAAEIMISVCGLVYLLGHARILYKAVRNGRLPSFRGLLLYLAVQFFLAAAGILPFAVLDSSPGDYVFPLWNMGFWILVLFLICAFCIIRKGFLGKTEGK